MTTAQESTSGTPPGLIRFLYFCLAAFLIGYAVYVAGTQTSALHWPYDLDHFRDIAASATVLEHGLGLDPYYKEERWWYNPLLPTLMGGIAYVSGAEVPLLYARLGTYLNVLAPIAFFLLVFRTANPLVAAAALLAFIYVTPRGTQAWHTATYSPWLFAATFAQPFFYMTLLAIAAMWRRRTVALQVIVGLGVGLTFLTHSAPALLLGLVIVMGACVYRERTSDLLTRIRTALFEVGTTAATAAIVGSPFLLAIAFGYAFKVRNWLPIEWRYDLLDLNRFGDLAYTHATPATALALMGVWRFSRRASGKELDRRIITGWAGANALLLLVGYARQIHPALAAIPSIVPEFHFLSYFRALIAVFAGWGFLALVEGTHLGVRRIIAAPRWVPSVGAIGLCCLVAAAFASVPRLSKRDDFGTPVTIAAAKGTDADFVAAYHWLRANVDRDAVVLAPDDLAQSLVGPAGRRVLAVDPYFSNPYVDYEPRRAVRDEMYRLLAAEDRIGFCRLAARNDVTLIVVGPAHPAAIRGLNWAPPSFVSGELTIATPMCGDGEGANSGASLPP